MDRPVKVAAAAIEDGAGVRIWRLFPSPEYGSFDPFVLLDEFFVKKGTGFPEHPHRGFEAVTYMIDGAFRHKDTLGNDTTVLEGGVQRFSAGKGIVHSEMPGSDEGCHGFQLWINLPLHLKRSEPEYQQVNPEQIKVELNGNVEIRTILGGNSPVKHFTPAQFKDFRLSGTSSLSLPVPFHNGFLYVYSGEIETEYGPLMAHEALFLKKTGVIQVEAEDPVRFIMVSGNPLNQPIVIRGSFVE